MLELKHVSLYKGFSDLLVGPCYEKLIIVICFFRQPSGEVDRCLKVHSLPVWGDYYFMSLYYIEY